MRATLNKLEGKWFAVPELQPDTLFGICTPNEFHVKKHGLEIVSDLTETDFKENKIVTGSLLGFGELQYRFKIENR